MKLDFGKTTLKINFSFAVAITFALLVDESGVGAIALLCCIVHEAGHVLCLFIFDEKPRKIELSFYGVKLERFPMSENCSVKDLVIYSAGPAANVIFSALVFLLSNVILSLRVVAVISLCMGLFNLVPCKPLDGGNILYTVLHRNMRYSMAETISLAVTVAVLVPMTVSGIYLFMNGGNITLFSVSVYLTAASCFELKKK